MSEKTRPAGFVPLVEPEGRKLVKIGSSIGIVIPAQVARSMQYTENTKVLLSRDVEGRLLVEVVK